MSTSTQDIAPNHGVEGLSFAAAASTTAAASTASPASPYGAAHAALFVAPDFDACSNWWPAANNAILRDAVVGMPHRSCRGCANWMPACDIEDAAAAAAAISSHPTDPSHRAPEDKPNGACANNWPKARNSVH